MSLSHCVERVSAVDPDRHFVLRGMPEAVQARLYPLFALNLEIGRAAWVSQEPLVCEMRLQWWANALEGLGEGKESRGQPVLEALAFLQGDQVAAQLAGGMVAARSWDVWAEPFADEAALIAHLDDTAGALMWLAARTLGAGPEAEGPVRLYGRAAGLAGWLRAVPELEARSRYPLADGRPEAVAALARRGLGWLAEARAGRAAVHKAALPALLTGWQADALLKLAADAPALVAAGQLELPEVRRRGTLAFRAITGRW